MTDGHQPIAITAVSIVSNADEQCKCAVNSNSGVNKMLSYRTETARQGALVLAKSGRRNWETIFFRHYTCRSIFNHGDNRPAKLSNLVKERKIRAVTPFWVI